MNIFFLRVRLRKTNLLFAKLAKLERAYPNFGLALGETLHNQHKHLLTLQGLYLKKIRGELGMKLVKSCIPGNKLWNARVEMNHHLARFRQALYIHLKNYQNSHQLDPKSIINVRIAVLLKEYFPNAIKTLYIGLSAMALLLASLVLLGSVAEDFSETARLVTIFAGKFLITCFTFFATKLPLLVLAKCTAVTTLFSALTIKEIFRPGQLWQTFAFRHEDVFFRRSDSLDEILYNYVTFIRSNELSQAAKLRLLINPFAAVVVLLHFARDVAYNFIDELPFNPDLQDKPSPNLYRIIKGLINIATEMTLIPLRVLRTLASLPVNLTLELADPYLNKPKKIKKVKKAGAKSTANHFKDEETDVQTEADFTKSSSRFITTELNQN